MIVTITVSPIGTARSTEALRFPRSRTTTLSKRKPSFVTVNPFAFAISSAIFFSILLIYASRKLRDGTRQRAPSRINVDQPMDPLTWFATRPPRSAAKRNLIAQRSDSGWSEFAGMANEVVPADSCLDRRAQAAVRSVSADRSFGAVRSPRCRPRRRTSVPDPAPSITGQSRCTGRPSCRAQEFPRR